MPNSDKDHERHLCHGWGLLHRLVHMSLQPDAQVLEEYKKLVRNPKYVCRQCGRAAAEAENLCDPVSL